MIEAISIMNINNSDFFIEMSELKWYILTRILHIYPEITYIFKKGLLIPFLQAKLR